MQDFSLVEAFIFARVNGDSVEIEFEGRWV